MSQPIVLLDDYGLGMKPDIPRSQMPRGAVWNIVDFIPRAIGAPLRKRGAWTWGSPLTAGGGYALGVAWAPFLGGAQLLKLRSDGNLYKVTNDTTESLVGALGVFPWDPQFYRDRVFYGEYGTTMAYYNGSAIATIAGAPQARHLTTYKDHLVASRGKVGATDFPQRTWFAAPGDPLTWDLTNSFVDHTFPVTGSVALRNMILVFGDSQAERILGSTPPTAVDIGDMARDPAFNVGCLDARSIATFGELAIWANAEGIWRTDGSLPENITKSGGMSQHWLNLMSGYQAGWQLAGGINVDSYVISVLDQNGVFKDCLMCDLRSLTWSRHSNVEATMFAEQGGVDELYFARRPDTRIGRLVPIFRPNAAIGADADGDIVLPVVETGYEQGDPTLKRWKDMLLNYVLDGSGVGTSPSLAVSVITSPEETAYTSIGAMPTAVDIRRDILPVRFDSPGMAFKLQQQLASGDTRLFQIAANVEALEGSRVR